MKKNISINISGIIFHIEEDGYENLRRYLDSITRYFSSFEDSSEIMADIESRIAEIFLSKLNEGKQVITAEDVASLITTMGSVSDFKAAEETETPSSAAGSATGTGSGAYTSGAAGTSVPPKSFQRDQKRKILGGVCSGIATYMNVDSLWVRLIFALLAFAWGLTIFIYIILWILIPGTYDLDEPETGKKMFRDPERKVLGGVSGGVATYLNIDIVAVRVLFLLLAIPGGFGVFLYIILWVILPEARTLTDRMQMQGEPVTLSNIESTLKKTQDTSAPEESAITKVLLFPFRVIGMILQALARVIGPIAEAIRVLAGVLFTVVGLSLLLSILVTGGIALGLLGTNLVNAQWENNFPLDAFFRAVPGWTLGAAFLAALIPALAIVLLGISVIARRIVFSAPVGWGMFAIFLVCAAMLGVGVPRIVMANKERGEVRVEKTYTPTGKTAVLQIREVGLDDYHAALLNLEGHDEKTFRLVQVFKSQGATRAKAIENAKMVDYTVSLVDSVFTFDSNLTFKPDAIFRGQELKMTLYIPYFHPFTLDAMSGRFIDEYIDWEYRDGHTWQMTPKGLECVSCPKPTEEEIAKAELRDFDQLDLNGIFDVRVYRGDEFSVELKGPEREKDKYKIYKIGKTLVVDFEGRKSFNWNSDKIKNDEVYISITMPEIEKVEASGVGSLQLNDFDEETLEIEIRGPIRAEGRINARDLLVDLTGKASLELQGRSGSMNATLEFASQLKAYNFEVENAIVEAKGASTAKVNVTRRLEMEEGIGSDIDFRGNPEIIENKP